MSLISCNRPGSKLAFYYLHKYACIYKTMSCFCSENMVPIIINFVCQVAKKRSGAGRRTEEKESEESWRLCNWEVTKNLKYSEIWNIWKSEIWQNLNHQPVISVASWPPVTRSVPQCRKTSYQATPTAIAGSSPPTVCWSHPLPNCSSVITKSLKMGDFYGK